MTSDPPPSVTAVVMAFNEVFSVARVVEEIGHVLRSRGVHYEILIVDDGSFDGTHELADGLAKTSSSVRVIHHQINQGLGGVYRTGFHAARGEFLTFFPADGQFPATIIGQFLDQIPAYDLVLGYIETRQSFLASALSTLERQLYRLLFGSLPRFQGVLMLRRQMLEEIHLHSNGRGWGVLMEFIIRSDRAGYRLVSVPTAFRPRSHGRSKVINMRTISANLFEVLTLQRHLRV
jgi:glycosyltransferase involved in cell wall biosynthesis